ncbi:Ig-like domain-containing protein [Enterococcus faecalis]|uniref:Ig-like domain-containing protein n=1 Tax=Enterococcus faecalis TaxID=1351 RepID=UPI003D1511FB
MWKFLLTCSTVFFGFNTFFLTTETLAAEVTRDSSNINCLQTVNPPLVDELTTADRYLTGQGIPRALIVVVTDEGKVLKSYVDSNGRFSVDLLNIDFSMYSKFSVYQNYQGCSSNPIDIYAKQEKQESIEKPKINAVTNKDTVVQGVADPSVFISMKIGTDVYQTIADDNGHFIINLDYTYLVGTNIEIYAYNQNGLESEHLFSKVIQGALDLGINYVTSNDMILTGYASPYTSIRVIIGNRVYTSTVDGSGYYQVLFTRSYNSGTVVSVTATDQITGNTIERSTLVYPKDPTISYTPVGADNVTGQADPYAEVKVTIAGKSYFGHADAAGSYRVYVSSVDIVQGSKIYVSQKSNSLESRVAELIIN